MRCLLPLLAVSVVACGAERVDEPLLELRFAHIDHEAESCITCHHNFVDDTGDELCFDCHKSHEEVAPLIEEQFHTLCRGCHEERWLAGEEAGPVRACEDCHQSDTIF